MKEQLPNLMYSIVVVTYNGLIDTVRCVESVMRHTQNFELILVDNGSKDGTVGYLLNLHTIHPNVKVIFNDKNENFGPANNQGCSVAQGKYLILLNSDTIVSPAWAEKMRECMESDKEIAMVGPMSSSSNGRQQVDGCNPNNVDEFALKFGSQNCL